MKSSYIANCLWKQIKSGFKLPYMVMFETTLMCNMFCEYCIFGIEGKFNDLQTRAVRERIFQRIDEFTDMGIFALSFSGGEPLLNPNTVDYIAYAADKGMWTSMPTNGLLIRKYADGVARLGMLEVSIDSLNAERFAKRRGINGLPKIIENLDYVLTKRKPFTTQINAAVNLENLEDLPELAEFCRARDLVLHPEAVHNVMRQGELLPDAELHGAEIDKVENFLRDLRSTYPKNVRFYTHYYEFYRNGGFGPRFPCRHPSKLISMKPDGSIHLPCAFVTLHQSQAPLKEIFASETARNIIAQESTLWDFCKGCKIGCPYEVSAFTNSPMLALESGLNFLRII
ncbi:MAG TPA: radical SAM protein [Terriglobia bacterium]|jgi:MoaA/NifB/PqqE/SkfB family radical SAM enzyme|nr:radical SAM protein [Terriglobia bacterium]